MELRALPYEKRIVELRQLRYFIAVAEDLSFSRAARRLHISQPPLSTQIMALERELQTRLFDRTNRGVSLTAAGRVFQSEMQSVLARLEHGKAQARHVGQGQMGSLSIGFVSIAAYSFLPVALKEFGVRSPGVEVQLHELTTDAQILELRAGRLDLGIALGPVQESDLVFEALCKEELVLAAPEEHRLSRAKGALELRLAAQENFIVPPRSVAPGLYDLVITRCHDSGFSPRITQHARQMQTVVSLVAAGMGVALVPSSVQTLRRVGVTYRRLRGSGPGVQIGMLRSSNVRTRLQDHFVATTKEAIKRSAS
jgi:DNA-binding transcriptional LysR family regulator